MPVPVTALYASLLTFLYIALSLKIAFFRKNQGVDLGDGGDKLALRAIRAHGNANEYIPLFLILLGLYELNGGQLILLHACGAGFFVARILHATGLSGHVGKSFGRFWGAVLTFTILLVLAAANLFRLYSL